MSDESFVDAIWHCPEDKLPPLNQTVPVRLLNDPRPTKALWSHHSYWVVQKDGAFVAMRKGDVACWLETTAKEIE